MHKAGNRILLLLFLSSIVLVLMGSCSAPRSSAVKKEGLSRITAEFIRQNLDYLASDSLKGRDTPSPGLDSAGEYIARFFRKTGLAPVNGSYFQYFSICNRSLGDDNHLRITANGKEAEFSIKTDFMPFEISGDNEVHGGLVFAGYGITAPEFQYDDYKNVDVRGKIVLLFRHEPRDNDSSSKAFNGKEPTIYSDLKEKLKNAKLHGAVGMMVVTEPLNYRSIRPHGYPWPSLSKTLPKDALPTVYCIEGADSIPVVHVGEEVIREIFGSVDSLRHLQRRIDSTLAPLSFNVPVTRIDLRTSMKNIEKYSTRNVVGFVEGSDTSLRKELVVIGAHYDHVGFLKEHKADSDYIFNGSDDNASGTCGVMAVARAMSSLRYKPARSVLFILFAGEEKGLFGSGYYVRRPLFPLENTVAMLNMDMISRNSPGYLEVIGAPQCPDLEAIVKTENKKTGFDLNPGNMMGGSDHWNFYRHDVPSIFFFTGFHKDYHKVTDNPDKSDAAKAARVAQLVFLTSWYIANDKKYYTIIHGKESDY